MGKPLSVILAFLWTSVCLRAAEPVDYARDVKPILKERCYACHAVLKQQGKLRLDSVAFLRKGGKHGPAVIPGKPGDSLLLERVCDAEESTRMPPEGKPLSKEQIATITTWISQGARAPAKDAPEIDPRQHWAFQPPKRPKAPVAADPAWSDNPIDRFVAAEHTRRGLRPNPTADRGTLLRRLYLDLIGLPPSPEELHAFLADQSQDAYERVVDKLLDSPQYGERWGRHWMDVWRYSDWYGRRAVPDVLNSYARIWRWRDWIVRSLNQDRGYDWMILQMLAGDELSPDDDSNVVATGFLVRNFFRWNYNNWMRDNVEHTGKAFLGLTLNCCHCHDHKYDPLTQEEYFRFRAFFEPLEIRHDRWPGEADPGLFPKYTYGGSYKPIESGMVRVVDEKLDAQTFMYSRGDERNRVSGKPAVSAGVPAALGGPRIEVKPVPLPVTAWYPGAKSYIRQEEMSKREQAIRTADGAVSKAVLALSDLRQKLAIRASTACMGPVPAAAALLPILYDWEIALADFRLAEAQWAAASAELEALRGRIAADDIAYLGAPGDPRATAQRAFLAERRSKIEAARAAQAESERLLVIARKSRVLGQIAKAQAALSAAQAKVKAALEPNASSSTAYTPLSPIYPRTSSGRRSALARWIASPENPLTARVAVNHIWGWHFGTPLVETTSNLGRSGKLPSNQQLLDWLAVELMSNGWRMKPIHRLLVTSHAYQLESRLLDAGSPNILVDRDNRYLWRFPTLRMEAEVIRDSILHASTSLESSMGGQEIPQDRGLVSHKRSLYFAHHGETRMEFLDLFDAANPCDAYRRTTSILPQQALALGNSELTLSQSRFLARQLSARQSSNESFIRAAFEQVLNRLPRGVEAAASLAFLERQAKLFEQQRAELGKGSVDAPAADPILRARENLVHALFNHTDFVTVR